MVGVSPGEPRIRSSELTSDDRQLWCSLFYLVPFYCEVLKLCKFALSFSLTNSLNICLSSNSRDSAVVDLQKRCTRSSSVLRLSSDQDQSQGSLSRKVGSVKCSNGIKSHTVCKRKEVKECSINLSLSKFPLELTSKLEISAEEVVSCYELPEILDKFSGCPYCLGIETQASSSDSHLKEASKRREDGTGNFLYYPTVMEFQQNNLEHFQTHWSKGHPVIVRSVLKRGSSLNWDPVAMFCCYLMNSNSKTGNNTDCMDWFEVSCLCSVMLLVLIFLELNTLWSLNWSVSYSMTGRDWCKAIFFGVFEREN